MTACSCTLALRVAKGNDRVWRSPGERYSLLHRPIDTVHWLQTRHIIRHIIRHTLISRPALLLPSYIFTHILFSV